MLKTLSNEAKVGLLVAATAALAVFFAVLLGVDHPFRSKVEFYVTYHFAGGIEVGSPVRVSGIKVGRVESVDFFVPVEGVAIAHAEPGSANEEGPQVVPVRLRLSVLREALKGIKTDSRFYINLAGIIGERYIEVTPGSAGAASVREDQTLPGVDPPRVDQLLSQSFDLAGKVTDLLEKNKDDITKSIETLYKLSVNLNKTVEAIDRSKVFKNDIGELVQNLIEITRQVKTLTSKVDSQEGKETLKLMHDLLWRLEPLKSDVIRKFLQKEGVRVRMF